MRKRDEKSFKSLRPDYDKFWLHGGGGSIEITRTDDSKAIAIVKDVRARLGKKATS